MNKVATLLLCVCFITVLFPQPGYIHPDEFLQSSEIVAGDVLQVIHTRAWEFNSTFPIRSIVFPYLLNAPSLHLLRWMNSTSFTGFKISAVKVVMATRLPIAFLNIFGYLATGKLATHFGAEKSLSTTLWCSSYVFWSYFTRTFSNSVESFLFGLVLLLTVSPIPASNSQGKNKHKDRRIPGKEKDTSESSNKNEPHREKNDPHYEKTESSTKEDELVLGNSHSDKFDLKLKSVFLGILTSAGFFNRPTFILFAFVPILYWAFSLQCRKHFTNRLTTLITIKFYGLIGALLVFVSFITVDTLYYNEEFQYVLPSVFHNIAAKPLSSENVANNFEVLFSSLVVTPWNFFKYNVDSSNLAEHGLHPRYTHLLVNLPLLLGPLYVPFVTVCFSSLFLSLKRSVTGNSLWLIAMALVPVFGLSIFPHQEPRFLIPLLPVFIVTGARIVSAMTLGRRAFLIMWVVFNVSLHLVYGYLHQAAVVPALSIYQQRLSASTSRLTEQAEVTEHMIFYKTYSPPRHLLLLHESRSEVKIHDLAGSHFKVLMKLVSGLGREIQSRKLKARIYVFLPATVSPRFLDLLPENDWHISASSICPHLSTESLPRFKEFWIKRIPFDDFLMDFCLNIIQVSPKELY